MKLYLNLLSLFLGIFCFAGIAVAEIDRVEELETQTEEIIESDRDNSELESEEDLVTEKSPEEIRQEELKTAFPGCPVTEDEFASVEVDTKTVETITDEEEEEATKLDSEAEIAAEVPEVIIDEIDENSSDEEIEKTESTEEEEEEETAENRPKCPTLEEITRYENLVEADRLYLAGEKIAAAKIYQEFKEVWDTEKESRKLNPAIYQDEELTPGGKVYWRTYQQGKKQQLESKILTPLKLIVTKDPNFIPGHITYTEELMAREREIEAYKVMEKAVSLYPNEIPLLKAKIATDVRGERWLDASISARQFALFNPDLPEAAEFTSLADKYLVAYQEQVEEELTWNAIGNVITGAAGFALTGNLYGPISAIETTMILLQGEAKLGARFARRAAKKLPLVEDETVTNYVQNIGDKIAAVAGRDEFEYEFFVIMDDNLNAFALPGGKIFVNAGAIMNTNSEAELAGLLAHEVAHSVLSHGFQLVTRGSLTANVAQYIPYVGSTASNLIVMNYSRDMERQADIFGTRILVAADYAADGVRNLMAKLGEIHAEDEEHQDPPVWLSTHPLTNQRVEYIEELVVENNLNRYAYEGVKEHQQIKNLTYEIWQKYQEEEAKEDED